jgi:hypothetical protein
LELIYISIRATRILQTHIGTLRIDSLYSTPLQFMNINTR